MFFFALIVYAIARLYRSAKRSQGRDLVATFLCALSLYSLANAMFSGDITSPKELYLCVFYALSTAFVVRTANVQRPVPASSQPIAH